MALEYTPDPPKPSASPFADLDYPAHDIDGAPIVRIPSTGVLASTAFQLRGLFGCSSKIALAGAVLLDQGRVADLFDLLDGAEREREAAAEAKRLTKERA